MKNQQPPGLSDRSKWRALEPETSNPRVEPNKIVGLVRPMVPAGEKVKKYLPF